MKKNFLILLLLAGSFFAHGQQFVQFNNTVTTAISTNSTPGGTAAGLMSEPAGSFYFALFASATATTVHGSANAIIPTFGSPTGPFVLSDPNWEYLTTVGNSGNPGRLAGGTVLCDLPSAQFVVLGWSANIGSSIASLESYLANPMHPSGKGFVGESVVSGTLVPGQGGGLIPNVFSPTPPGVPGFVLGEVPLPEGSSTILASVGGLILWALRRKKSTAVFPRKPAAQVNIG